MHIALRQERRLDLVWDAKQVATFDRIKAMAKRASEPLPDFVKRLLAKIAHYLCAVVIDNTSAL